MLSKQRQLGYSLIQTLLHRRLHTTSFPHLLQNTNLFTTILPLLVHLTTSTVVVSTRANFQDHYLSLPTYLLHLLLLPRLLHQQTLDLDRTFTMQLISLEEESAVEQIHSLLLLLLSCSQPNLSSSITGDGLPDDPRIWTSKQLSTYLTSSSSLRRVTDRGVYAFISCWTFRI